MDNPVFVNERDFPLVQDKEYYDENDKTPGTSRIDEASFMIRNATEATSTVRLRQGLKGDKTDALYRHLNVNGNPDLIDFNRFRLTKDPKKGVTIFEKVYL